MRLPRLSRAFRRRVHVNPATLSPALGVYASHFVVIRESQQRKWWSRPRVFLPLGSFAAFRLYERGRS